MYLVIQTSVNKSLKIKKRFYQSFQVKVKAWVSGNTKHKCWLHVQASGISIPYVTKIYWNMLQNIMQYITQYIWETSAYFSIYTNLSMHWQYGYILIHTNIFRNEDKNTSNIHKVWSFIEYILHIQSWPKISAPVQFCQKMQHFSQKIVPVANVLVFTCLLFLFALQQHKTTEKKSQTWSNFTQNSKMDWTKWLAPCQNSKK